MQVVVPGSGRRYEADAAFDGAAPLAWTVPDVLAPAACRALIAEIEELGPAPAPITTAAGFVMRPDLRNNTRVIFDRVPLAIELFTHLAYALPPRLFDRRVVSINERFRCYRYAPGQRFAPHRDGAFARSATERSELTLMVYLNDDFTGGTTDFLEHAASVTPRTGAALLFQHLLLHEGCAVATGVKYVLRTDVMYANDDG